MFFPFAVRKQEALLTKESIIKLAIDCEQKLAQACHMSYCHLLQETFFWAPTICRYGKYIGGVSERISNIMLSEKGSGGSQRTALGWSYIVIS